MYSHDFKINNSIYTRSNIKDFNIKILNSEKIQENSKSIQSNKLRRTFSEFENENLKTEKEMTMYLSSLNELFEYFSKNVNDWQDRFIQFLGRKSIIEIIDYIPHSNCNQGTILLSKTMFWILYIELVRNKYHLKIDKISCLLNQAFNCNLNDMDLMFEFFYITIEKFGRNEIYSCILRNNSNSKYCPENINDLNKNHYKYILSNPEYLIEYEINKIMISGNKKRRFRPKSEEKLEKKRNDSTTRNWEFLKPSIKEENFKSINSKKIINLNKKPKYSDKEIAIIISNFLTKDDIKKNKIFEQIIEESNDINKINCQISQLNLDYSMKIDPIKNNIECKCFIKKFDKETQTCFLEMEDDKRMITYRKIKNKRYYSEAKKLKYNK